MRATLATAVACLALGGLAAAADTTAAIRKPTSVPADELRSALKTLAQQFGFQVLYQTEVVGTKRTEGVSGAMTAAQALEKVLSGTGLTYRYIDEKTVMILPVRFAAPAARNEANAPQESQRHDEAKDGDPTNAFLERDDHVGQGDGNTVSPESPQSVELQEITVTAQRRKERLQDVPISISVLGGEQLDNSTEQGVMEALNSVPGVSTISGLSGSTLLAVRGVTAASASFSGPSPIAYYLDSVPYGLVDSALVPDTDPYDLQRVEALRGPQGTLYGAGGEGGVVRVLTNDADPSAFELKGRAIGSSTQFGAANYGGDMAINVPLVQDVVAARAVIDYENLSGWIDKPTRKNANDAQMRTARFKINAQPMERLSVGLSAWVSRQDYGAPSMGNDKRQNTQPGNSPVTVNYEAYGAKLRYDFSSFSVTSMTSYLNHRESDTLDYGEYIGLPTYPLYERYDGDVSSEEVNVSSNANGSWVWSGGAIYRDGKNFTSQRLAPFATLDWTARSRSYALFGELSHRFLADRLEWTLGARNFHDNVAVEEGHLAAPLNPAFGYYREEDLFDSTTPRAVLTWKPEKGAMVYASYAEGFRSGEPEAYYSVGGVPGFPAVKPDKLHNYEVGAKADLFGGLVSIDTAAYYMKWNDVQQVLLVPFKSTIVSALINGQSASGPGVDLGLTLRLLKGLELVGSVSWNDLTVDRDVISGGAVLFKSGDRLNFSPKSTVSAAASYSFPVGARGFQGRVSASFHSTSAQSARTIAGGRAYITEGDTILLARTSLSVMAPTHWNLSLYADNVTNDQGIVSRNPALGIPLPNWDVRVRPRTVGVQFDYHY